MGFVSDVLLPHPVTREPLAPFNGSSPEMARLGGRVVLHFLPPYSPDGNRIEVYCDLMEPLAGKKFMAERPEPGKPFTVEPAAAGR